MASACSREEGMGLSFLPLTTETASKSKAAEAAVQHLKLLYQRRNHHKLMRHSAAGADHEVAMETQPPQQKCLTLKWALEGAPRQHGPPVSMVTGHWEGQRKA